MALAYTVLTQGSDSTASSSYTTLSFTPSPNSLLLLIVAYTGSGAQPLPVVTSSADSATWNDLQTAAAARSISVFRRSTSSSPPSVQATISHPTAATYTSCIWAVVQITGADLSGANNGLSAIAQTAIGNGNGTSSSVVLASAPAADSATVYAQIHPTTENVTARAGWTEIVELQETGPTSTVEGQIRLSGGEQTGGATWTTTGAWRGIIVEVKAATAPSGDATVTGVTATATATAPAPSVAADALVTAVTSTATALAVPPVVDIGATVIAVTATATALAASPVVTSGSTIASAVATATAAALAPTVSPGSAPGGGTVLATVATATATALAPGAVGGAVAASVAATSTALALPPTVTAEASLVVHGSVVAVRAWAYAAAQAPVVAGEQYATVEVPRIFMQALCHRPRVEVIDLTFRFECPTHEAPMWSPERIHQFYRITHAASVVRVGGSLTVIHQPRADQIAAAGEEGVDYFLGGRIYQVSLATRTELLAAGFDVE